MSKPLRARETFWWGQRIVNAGDIVSSDDPVTEGREHLFEAVDTLHDAAVEKATAAPGEKRTVRRRR